MSEPNPSQPMQSTSTQTTSTQSTPTSQQVPQPAPQPQQAPQSQQPAPQSQPQSLNQPKSLAQPQPLAQPEYGQFKQPEYGQLAAAYPGYNPYIYGEPEPPASQSEQGNAVSQSIAQHRRQGAHTAQAHAAQSHAAQSYSNQPRGAQTGNAASGDQRNQRLRSRIADRLPFNPDDPQENPVYGSWDTAAIIAFICALFSIPVLPLILGGIAIYRDRILHLKGRGLAIAAVILSLISTAFSIYFYINGIDPLQWVLSLYGIDPSSLEGSDTTQA